MLPILSQSQIKTLLSLSLPQSQTPLLLSQTSLLLSQYLAPQLQNKSLAP